MSIAGFANLYSAQGPDFAIEIVDFDLSFAIGFDLSFAIGFDLSFAIGIAGFGLSFAIGFQVGFPNALGFAKITEPATGLGCFNLNMDFLENYFPSFPIRLNFVKIRFNFCFVDCLEDLYLQILLLRFAHTELVFVAPAGLLNTVASSLGLKAPDFC